MKIISWNVNGIRAGVRKGLVDFIKRDNADIYCFQEIKAGEHQIPEALSEITFPAPASFTSEEAPSSTLGINSPPRRWARKYHQIWFPAERPGYAGTGVLTKIKPVKISTGINAPDFDAQGRTINLEFENFILINAYFPHPGWGLINLEKKKAFCKAFEKYLLKLRKPTIIAGDFNVAHTELDLARPKQNAGLGMFTKVERDWFERLINRGYVDVWRQFHPEERQYTWWSNRAGVRAKDIGWRLDYFVVDKCLINQIKSCEIKSDVAGSDHCPVELEIN